MEEVSQGRNFDVRRCAGFLSWTDDHEVIDMGVSGPCYTWTRGTSTETFKGARLDRALCNPEWRSLFDTAEVTHLPKLNSDQSPILIRLSHSGKSVDQLTRLSSDIKRLGFPILDFKRLSRIIGLTAYLCMKTSQYCHQRKRRLWARLAEAQKKLAIQENQKLLGPRP